MPKRKKFFKWKNSFLFTTIVVFFAFVYFLSPILSERGFFTSIRSYLPKYDFSMVLDYLIFPFNRNFNRLDNQLDVLDEEKISDIKNDLKNLQRQIQVKENLIQSLYQLKSENEKLRTLLNYRSNIIYSVVPAEIISYKPQNHFYFFWINVGKNQMIKNKMPVVSFNHKGKQGLVGFVKKTLKNSSLIQTVLDPQTHIGILIEGHETKAILKGDNQLNRLLYTDYINNEFTNLVGKSVFTLKTGERYPPKIVIGEIISTNSSLHGLFQRAMVKPIIDFTSLQDVFVITHTNK